MYADSGYVTVTYSVRGQDDSGSLSTVFSYREQQDLECIIDWLAHNPVVDSFAIGVSGGSQGGFHSWFVAVNGMNVKAVAPANSIPKREDAGARYSFSSTALAAELESYTFLRLATLFCPLKQWLFADNYDSVRSVVARGRNFDSTAVAASLVRYLMMGAWHDHVIPHNRMPGVFAVAPRPSFMYLGVGGHSSGHFLTETMCREDLRHGFFAENLKGEDHGLDAVGPVVVSLGPDWVRYEFESWPPSGTPTYLTQISLGQRENLDSTLWHTMQGEFVIIGWEIPPGYRLRSDWTSINETLGDVTLWAVPYWNADGTLALGLDAQHSTSIRIPVLDQTGMKGDAYGDRVINVLDAVTAVNIILDVLIPTPSYTGADLGG